MYTCIRAVILLLVLFPKVYGQNHVPNASFEQANIPCPSNFTNCVAWYSPNTASPDHFRICNPGNFGIPINSVGRQLPAHGVAYAGIVTYNANLTAYKEYLATTITPLQIGMVYEISLSVSAADASQYYTDDLNVFFYDNGTVSGSTSVMLNVTPQISFGSWGVFTDTANWTRVSATFLADSAYDNMIIGGFKLPPVINVVSATGTVPAAYLYIDSVVVRLVNAVTINYTNTQLCAGAAINVPYTLQNVTFVPGNTFTLQLSDAAGSFAAPVNIGSVTSTSTMAGNVPGIIPPGTLAGTGYKLRVVSSNPTEISNTTGNITINAMPSGITVGSNSPVCAGGTINLTSGSTTPGISYSWTGPVAYNTVTQNASRTNVTVPMAGYYVVTVNSNGCTAKDSVLVNVQPALNINATSNSPICNGGTLQLNASGGGTSYSWNGPNSFTANTQNTTIPNVTAAATGIYRLIANNGPCVDTTYTTVALGTPPAAPTAGSNSPVCSGNIINLTALSTTPGVTYSWTGPGGYNSNQQNPVRVNATLAMSGTYTVTASVGACPSPPVTTQVVVNQTPTTPTPTNNGPLCAGATLNLSATALAGATYQWSGPAGYNSTAQNPTLTGITTANAGNYSVTRTVNGCTSAAGTTNIMINNAVNPAIAVFPSPNDTICPGQAVVFVASPNNGGTAPQYQWKKNGNNIPGAITSTYSTSVINSGDFFSCEMVSSAACAFPQTVQSSNILITVEPPQPCAVSITANPGLVLSPWELVTFTAMPQKGGTLPVYQWLRNGKPVIGAVSNTWGANNLNSNDTISVVLFSADPCAVPPTDTSNYLVVNIKTGINSIKGVEGLTLYPNPNNGDFTIRGNLNSGTVRVAVLNAIGQLVYDRQVEAADNQLDHNIKLDVASGVYLLKVSLDDKTEVIRFSID